MAIFAPDERLPSSATLPGLRFATDGRLLGDGGGEDRERAQGEGWQEQKLWLSALART